MRERKMIIKKDNKLILAGYRISEVAKKVILQYISMIRIDDKEITEYKISLNELKKEMNITTRNYDIFERITNELMKPFYLTKNEKTAWISYAKIDSGIMSVKIAQELKPYLIDLQKNFTQYNYENIIELSSFYTIRIYEIITMYYNKGQKSFDITLDELSQMLAIPASYKWQDIKRQVLDSSKKQLDTKEITFKYEIAKKIGKKIEAIKITIEKTNNPMKDLKTFIKYVRENFKPNDDKYPTVMSFDKGDLKVDNKGFLYLNTSDKNYTKEQSLKLWQFLFEHCTKNGIESLGK